MSDGDRLILHDYWRSGAAYRTRIALNLKGIGYESVPHDLRAGAHKAADYLALNPQGLVPALELDGAIIVQSSAIIEWLDETCPDPPLLPPDALGRAIVRGMAMTVACDIHPLNNLRIRNWLRDELGCDKAQVFAWIAHWIAQGFAALEQSVARYGGRFAYGDSLTLADCHIVPQLYAAQRFDVPMAAFPRLTAVAANAAQQEPVARAHPDRQEGRPADA